MKANDIAVLYFDDRSPDDSLRYLANGLTEALIHELGTVKALHVTSRNGVMPFKGKDVAPDSIAKALSVGTIVSGTIAASGDKIRVTVDMLDARTGNSIGSTKIEKTKQDAFALQDTLVTEVSAVLRKQLGQQVEVLTSKAGTSNAAAWEAYQRAMQTATQGDSLVGAGDIATATHVLASADSELGAVAGQDGKWSAPPAQQAVIAYRLARLALATGAGLTAVGERIDAGIKAADKAIAASPNDADALDARGSLRYLQWLLGLAPGDADKAVASAEADLTAVDQGEPLAGIGDEHAEPPVRRDRSRGGRKGHGGRRLQGRSVSDGREQDGLATVQAVQRPGVRSGGEEVVRRAHAPLPDRLPVRRVPALALHGEGPDSSSDRRRDLEGERCVSRGQQGGQAGGREAEGNDACRYRPHPGKASG